MEEYKRLLVTLSEALDNPNITPRQRKSTIVRMQATNNLIKELEAKE